MNQREKLSEPDAAHASFVRRQAVLMVLFALAIVGAFYVVGATNLRTVRWVATAVPVAVLVLWGVAFVRMIRAEDEMLQMAHLRAVAIGGGLVLFTGTVWGLFERLLATPPYPAFLLLPAFAIIYSGILLIQGVRGL